MTLGIGDKVVKIDRETGQPCNPDSEGHVEFEVMENVSSSLEDGAYTQTVKLKVLR